MSRSVPGGFRKGPKQAPFWRIALVLELVGCHAADGRSARDGSSGGLTEASASAASSHPLGLDAAREAHRRAELRRHIRFREAVKPGYFLRATAAAVSQENIDAGDVSPARLREVRRLIFDHEYSFADGLGNGRSRELARSGSPFRRVHKGRFGGPESTTCTSCHWRRGPAGAGSLQDASFLYGDGDRPETADARNPSPLQGVGVVQLLAREMTGELQSIRSRLVAESRRSGRPAEGELRSKGVSFGVLRVEPDGTVDSSVVEGVDPDLVVRPFGWKGTFATLRDFVSESLQVHFGIQSEDLVLRHRAHPDTELLGPGLDPDDPDGDGVTREITSDHLTALVTFLALQEIPVVEPPETLHEFDAPAKNLGATTTTVFVDDWAHGRRVFREFGCSVCHTPMLVLNDPLFRTRSEATGEEVAIDFSKHGKEPRIRYDRRAGGYPVWLFSDMKRHDMGIENASRHVDHGVAPESYLTRRLWGLASSPPYFDNGRAAWFDDAIKAHGGEAATSREAFRRASREEKGALRVYLVSLRRQRQLIVP